MSVTYLRLAENCPSPIPSPAAVVGDGSSGSFSTGMVAGVSNSLNQLEAWVKLAARNGAGAYATIGAPGGGVDVTSPSGLNVAISAGVVLAGGVTEFVAANPYGYQVLIPPPYTLADNATNFLWLTAAGALIANTTVGSPPSGAVLFLATVTTVSGAVTNIDYSGRIYLSAGGYSRQTADVGAPLDSPSICGLKTLTTTGIYEAAVASSSQHHVLQPAPPNVQTITGTLTLTPLSPRQQFLTASGGDQTVELPDPSLLPPGDSFQIFNAGTSHNLVVKDHTGATTFVTVGNGLGTLAPTVLSGSTVSFPATLSSAAPVPTPSGPLYKQSAAGTPVTATASETQAAVASIPANTIGAGTVLRLTYWGRITSGHFADTVQVRIRFGSTTLTGNALVPGSAVANPGGMVFKGEVFLTGYAAPSASSAMVGISEYFDPIQTLSAVAKNAFDMSPMNFATNATLLAECTIQFSSNNAGNSGLVDGFMLEAL